MTAKAQPSSQPAAADPRGKIVLGQTVAGVGPALPAAHSISLSRVSGGAGANASASTPQQLSSSCPAPAPGFQSSHRPGTAEQLRLVRSNVTTPVVLSVNLLYNRTLRRDGRALGMRPLPPHFLFRAVQLHDTNRKSSFPDGSSQRRGFLKCYFLAARRSLIRAGINLKPQLLPRGEAIPVAPSRT